eukprot:PRCOL_00005283-RA
MAMVAPARGERERGVGEMAAALGRQRGPRLTQSGRDRSAPGSTRASCLSPTDVDTLRRMGFERHTDDWEEPDTAYYADSDSDSDDDEGERTHRRARLRRKVWDPFGGMKVSRRFEAPRPPAMVHACR